MKRYTRAAKETTHQTQPQISREPMYYQAGPARLCNACLPIYQSRDQTNHAMLQRKGQKQKRKLLHDHAVYPLHRPPPVVAVNVDPAPLLDRRIPALHDGQQPAAGCADGAHDDVARLG